MQQWEHKVIPGSAILDDEDKFLEERGLLGWELVSVIWMHNLSKEKKYYFKRPIQQPSTGERIFDDVKKQVEGMTDAELTKAYYEK